MNTAPGPRGFRNFFFLALAAFAAAALASPTFSDPPRQFDREHWYRIEMAGQPAGWMSARETWRGEVRANESKTFLRFRRGTAEQTIEIETLFEETLDGKPRKAWIRQALGSQPVEITYRYTAEGISSESVQAGQRSQQLLPLPEISWMPPGLAQDTLRAKLEQGSSSFRLHTVDPQAGILPFETRWELEQRDVVLRIGGREVITTRWRQSQSLAPGLESTVHLDAEGTMVRSSTPMMGMLLHMELVSRAEALAFSGAPELLLRTFIYPDRIIENPRKLRAARFEVGVTKGHLEELPSMGYQRVEHHDNRAVVGIDLDQKPPANALGPDEKALYLRSSTFFPIEDPILRQLHQTASADLPAAPEHRAEAFRRFVEGYLEDKNLDSVLATASEAASRKAGDCTEHSVLFAALLRADGIPSRVVGGLVYVESFAGAESFFGYHMWTQAHLDNRWVDLDATLSSPFDATHIALVTSALSDDGSGLANLGRIGSWLGRAEIKILEPLGPRR